MKGHVFTDLLRICLYTVENSKHIYKDLKTALYKSSSKIVATALLKSYQINKEENLNILCPQAFNLAPKNGSPSFGNSIFNRCHQERKKSRSRLCHLEQNMLFLVKSNPEFLS